MWLLCTSVVIADPAPGQVFYCENENCGATETGGDTCDELLEMDLEDLMNITVTLASKTEEKAFEVPSAVFVLTQEDIRRSGATSLPEVLRMVPGVFVSRINSNHWAVTVRGFTSEYSKFLLVLIDGRTVYNPFFAGVYWNMNDVMLEDIDRIEVIRGPGGTLWGANAVNGIINIITKSAEDTQDALIILGGGIEEQAFASARYGGALSDKLHYRVYGKYFDRDDFVTANGSRASDEWQTVRSGFRLDWKLTDEDSLTVQGDIFDGNVAQRTNMVTWTAPYLATFDETMDVRGGNLLARWKRELSRDSDIAIQVFYDKTHRLERTLREKRDTYDLDFQHRFQLCEWQEVVWGLGYRVTMDNIGNSEFMAVEPDSRVLSTYSAFLQDRISIIEDRLNLYLGAKIEDYDLTGVEHQPSARILWTPTERHALWAGITRAVRTPARFDHDIRFSPAVYQAGPNLIKLEFYGDKDFESEILLANEIGYRQRITDDLNVDITAFLNDYDNLITYESGTSTLVTTPVPHLLVPRLRDHRMKGETYGVESTVNWSVTEEWQLAAAYSLLQMQLHTRSSSINTTRDEEDEGRVPHNILHLHSYLDLFEDFEFDTSVYYVDNLPTSDIDNFIRCDARIGWHITENTELSLVGQNLFDPQHPENISRQAFHASEVERSFFLKLTCRF